ncbi:hypothetical protein [Niameybacter massiliensis]|uniref:hypothetical protein n=1 Tax=Niameybacter massiliensis TaxID=1658108 RepID=UPI0006B5E478|nr:hypothetical protein [Niameybacter massiliensis]
MNKMKYITSILVLGATLMAPTALMASEVKADTTKNVNTTATNEVAIVKEGSQTSTSSAITFKKDEYVRITQSLNKEKIQTFDSQINIMGEARTGTKIEIIVYTGEKMDTPAPTETNSYKVYKVKEVGATKMFSQLIDLSEGTNHVIIKYTYEPDDKRGSQSIIIERKTEVEKEKIKTFIADDASGILGKINEPAAKTTPAVVTKE